MLKNIPRSFTPELMKLMMQMGHGEELLLADANYPALSAARAGVRLYVPVPNLAGLLADIVKFFPLDEAVDCPAVMMESAVESGAYAQCRTALSDAGVQAHIDTVERFAFYDRGDRAVGVVVTADTIKGGNILLKKGVVREQSADAEQQRP
ncbi:MAG: RbsD/FucU domain-containing protein [Eubacteriales bacterium]|nr:RbsD/FucU domain-containing protein [Eubacteriales bacterium]